MRAAPLAAAAALLAAGCGGGSGGGDSTAPTTLPTTASASADPENGRRIFTTSGCGVCHALAAAGVEKALYTDLDETRPGYGATVVIVRDGGEQMPRFDATLSDQEISDVAAFVAEHAGR